MTDFFILLQSMMSIHLVIPLFQRGGITTTPQVLQLGPLSQLQIGPRQQLGKKLQLCLLPLGQLRGGRDTMDPPQRNLPTCGSTETTRKQTFPNFSNFKTKLNLIVALQFT